MLVIELLCPKWHTYKNFLAQLCYALTIMSFYVQICNEFYILNVHFALNIFHTHFHDINFWDAPKGRHNTLFYDTAHWNLHFISFSCLWLFSFFLLFLLSTSQRHNNNKKWTFTTDTISSIKRILIHRLSMSYLSFFVR